MIETRKTMSTAKETFNISNEAESSAMATYNSSPVMNMNDAVVKFRLDLNCYCEKYQASNHQELMTRADELEFDPKICAEILDKYSFIERHQI